MATSDFVVRPVSQACSHNFKIVIVTLPGIVFRSGFRLDREIVREINFSENFTLRACVYDCEKYKNRENFKIVTEMFFDDGSTFSFRTSVRE